MGPTRKRDLAIATVLLTALGYVVTSRLFGAFPPIRILTGVSLLAVAVVLAGWAFYVRSKIADGKIGVGPGRLHPLAVARGVMIAKAAAWVGALTLGWWLGVSAFFLSKRGVLRVAAEGSAGAVVAAASALALVVAALWLEHCCKSPDEPTEDPDGVRS
ncbi:DUF3180 domain-containing protein [Mycolicibacterium sp. P1-18]|uniref:DUF3180 domain-containing protein n=1 Tax=Mycolicibacterium sp. P1-18 TaxID=2024615 RepID=UPI0011F21294|nr:DUF3180 domain-containing protein [Mycolicibacterium sp. P1-18]KAA0097529.1 DUF3180 domain-containing protein [Mycolicibacterium sp. P1-18]